MGKKVSIEDVKDRIVELQEMDAYNAALEGFTEKADWYNYVMVCENDEVADLLITYANNNGLDLTTLSELFDQEEGTMVMRVGRRLQRQLNAGKGPTM